MRAAGRLLLSRGGGGGRRCLAPPATSIHRTIISSRRVSSSSSSISTGAATDAAAAAAATAAAAVPGAIWLPLPRLAPHMTTGRVQAWLKANGEAVACYEVIAEVASGNLVEAAHRVGRFAGEVPLLLEAQEEGFVARILRPVEKEKEKGGLLLRVGTPIAVLCEEEEEVRGGF